MSGHQSDIHLKKTAEEPVADHFCFSGHKIDHLLVMVVNQTPTGDIVLWKTGRQDRSAAAA